MSALTYRLPEFAKVTAGLLVVLIIIIILLNCLSTSMSHLEPKGQRYQGSLMVVRIPRKLSVELNSSSDSTSTNIYMVLVDKINTSNFSFVYYFGGGQQPEAKDGYMKGNQLTRALILLGVAH